MFKIDYTKLGVKEMDEKLTHCAMD